jgi:hypothetical protein
MKLTTHLRLLPSLRMGGAIAPLPAPHTFVTWCFNTYSKIIYLLFPVAIPFIVWFIIELLAIITATFQIHQLSTATFKALYTNSNLTLCNTTNLAGFHTTWLHPIQATAKRESYHRHQWHWTATSGTMWTAYWQNHCAYGSRLPASSSTVSRQPISSSTAQDLQC